MKDTTTVTTTENGTDFNQKKWDEFKTLYFLLAVALIASMILNICLILVR